MLASKSTTTHHWLKKATYSITLLSIITLACLPTLAGPRFRSKRIFFIFQDTASGSLYRPGEDSITRTLAKEERYRTFVSNLRSAQLDGELNGQSIHTVFVPTNRAFQNLSEETYNKLREGNNLERVLKRHIVAGELNGNESEIRTIGGDSLSVVNRADEDGTVTIDNVNARRSIYTANNGVIIEVDRVLLPPDF